MDGGDGMDLISAVRTLKQDQQAGCTPVGPGLIPLFAAAAMRIRVVSDAVDVAQLARITGAPPLGTLPTTSLTPSTDAHRRAHTGSGQPGHALSPAAVVPAAVVIVPGAGCPPTLVVAAMSPSRPDVEGQAPVIGCAVATTTLYHYGCGIDADFGWGCGYRCCQILLSAVGWKNIVVAAPVRGTKLSDVPRPTGAQHGPRPRPRSPHSPNAHLDAEATVDVVPEIEALQTILVGLGRGSPNDVGSERWIEPPDVAAILNHLTVDGQQLDGHSTRFASIDYDTATAVTRAELAERLRCHFHPNNSTGELNGEGGGAVVLPIMIDNGLAAYCICGVSCPPPSSPRSLHATPSSRPSPRPTADQKMFLLRYDPHAVGMATVQDYTNALRLAATSDDATQDHVVQIQHHGVAWMTFDSIFHPDAANNVGGGLHDWMVLWPTTTPTTPAPPALGVPPNSPLTSLYLFCWGG
jgi:hypothetical protein